MRHRVAHRKLGRTTEHRIALLRNLCTSLIVNERLITTLPKAKELRPFAERVITISKRALTAEAPEAAVHARRLASGYFHSGNNNRVPDGGYKRPRAPRTAGVLAVEKLFDELAARFADRPGGYTRILKLGARKGDGAEMALIELVGSEAKAVQEEAKPEEKKGRRFFGRGKKADAGDTKTGDDKPAKKASAGGGAKASRKPGGPAGGAGKPKGGAKPKAAARVKKGDSK